MRRLPNVKFKDVERYPLGFTYVDYNKKPIKLFGSLEIPIASKGWKIENTCLMVSKNRTRNLLRLNLHEQLGIETVQRNQQKSTLRKMCRNWIRPLSSGGITLSKGTLMCSAGWGGRKTIKFSLTLKTLWYLGKLNAEKSPSIYKIESRLRLEKLINDKHIERLEKCTTDHFIAPIALTAKKDGPIKLALNAKPINAQIWQNKYQMPNMHEFIDSVAQIISRDTPGKSVPYISWP